MAQPASVETAETADLRNHGSNGTGATEHSDDDDGSWLRQGLGPEDTGAPAPPTARPPRNTATGRLHLTVAYNGEAFSGFQLQAGCAPSAAGGSPRTVQLELETAAARVFGSPVRVVGASRTDAGVSARGQGAHCDPPPPPPGTAWPPPSVLLRRFNALLPPDVRLVALRLAPPGFNAQSSCRGKEYRYYICADWAGPDPLELPRRWWVLGLWQSQHKRPADRESDTIDLDLGAMAAAAQAMTGERDFSLLESTSSGAARRARRKARAALGLQPRTQSVTESMTESLTESVVGPPAGVLRGGAAAAAAAGIGGDAFAPGRELGSCRSTVRRLWRLDVIRDGPGRYHLELEGGGFLYQMARNIARVVVDAGAGRLGLAALRQALESGKCGDAGSPLADRPAPACGLVLQRIMYDE